MFLDYLSIFAGDKNVIIMANKKTGSKKVSSGRPKPLTPKVSVTRNGKRRYGCGGKLK